MNPKRTALKSLELGQIPETAWELLREGVNSGKSPLHTPCLGTTGEHGPALRTVVLRHCIKNERVVACHCDRRSAKVREALDNPWATWLFYDRERKLQLRMAGPATVHLDDDFADRAWKNTRDMGRACYNTMTGPGQYVPAPSAAPGRITGETEERSARHHFAVIACRVEFIDWLVLSVEGHRRAHFHWRQRGWQGNWISP